MRTCHFKFLLKGGSVQKLKRNYEKLTGKQSPPIDAWSFTGMVKDTNTRFFPDPIGMVQFRRGRVATDIYHLNSNIVGLVIAVDNYSNDSMHGSHAISAVKYKNTLFCFNAHGSDALRMDKTIFRQLAQEYKCTNMLTYSGPGFQYGDPHGVCVGYAVNFIAEMFLAIEGNKIPKKITQPQYDDFVSRAINSRGLCFGGTCVSGNNQLTKWNKIHASLAKQHLTNFTLNRLDNLENLTFQQIPEEMTNLFNTYNITTPVPVSSPKPNVGGNRNRNKAVAAKTLSSLKDIARKRKIKGFSVYKKAQMENLRRRILNNINRKPVPGPGAVPGAVPGPVPGPGPVASPKPNVGGNRNRNKAAAAKTLSSLKDIARKRKIKGFSVYKKAQMENLRRRILNNIG